MNQKLNLLIAFCFVLGMGMFTSCQSDDDIIVPEVFCDSLFQVTLTMDMDSVLLATATDGVEPYTYLWSDGSTNNTLEFWNSPNPSVTVTDANDCTTTATFDLGNSTSCDSFVTEIVVSGDSSGVTVLYVNSSGGTGPYAYLWSDGSSSSSLTVTGAGDFSVTVTDANECVAEDSASVTEPEPCDSFYSNVYASDSLGVNVLFVNASGGTAPYTYSWSTGETGSYIETTNPGVYTVVVTDANGCTSESTYEVTVNNPCANFLVTIYSNPDSLGGTADYLNAILSNGTGPYTYLWSTGGTEGAIEITTGGSYSVTATDANGCVAEDDIEI